MTGCWALPGARRSPVWCPRHRCRGGPAPGTGARSAASGHHPVVTCGALAMQQAGESGHRQQAQQQLAAPAAPAVCVPCWQACSSVGCCWAPTAQGRRSKQPLLLAACRSRGCALAWRSRLGRRIPQVAPLPAACSCATQCVHVLAAALACSVAAGCTCSRVGDSAASTEPATARCDVCECDCCTHARRACALADAVAWQELLMGGRRSEAASAPQHPRVDRLPTRPQRDRDERALAQQRPARWHSRNRAEGCAGTGQGDPGGLVVFKNTSFG
jgi:hypothetical protein